MSNFGITGKALTDERQAHGEDCPARATVNDLSDCDEDTRVPCAAHKALNGGTLSQYQTWCPSCRSANAKAFRCRCGKNAFATEAEADAFNSARTVVTHPNGGTTSFATKCADCGTFATDHEFNGSEDSDFRCYFDDIRSGSHR